MKGKCVNISRKEAGYQDRLNEDQVGLRELKCEVYFGGFVWVSLNDDIGVTVAEFAAGSLRRARCPL